MTSSLSADAEGPGPGDILAPFVPALLRALLADDTAGTERTVRGTLALVDISGFTQLTERLARRGKVGAEELTEILNALFSELLTTARDEGAYLLKWSGDAVVLLFQGDRHADRAARAAHRMRSRLSRVGTVRTAAGRARVRMSAGLHSGELNLFLVGDPRVHRELVVCGPAATRTVEIGSAAGTDEIRLSAQTAALLPAACVDARETLPLLTRAPERDEALDAVGPVAGDPRPATEAVLAQVLPPPVREHLLADEPAGEHRKVAVAFVRLTGTDALLADSGTAALAAALDECVRLVQHAARQHGVTFLESDVDTDAGRIMLVAGAPRAGERNEDRLLRTVQHVLGAGAPLPVQAGVARGAVFTGVLGPPFCRTYSVKGDAVNVAARLAAAARPGEALVTLTTLAHAGARFEHEVLPPVTVKGKSAPIELARLGASVLQRLESATSEGELLGRDAELAVLRGAAEAASRGSGGVVEIVGEPGIGKTRLAQALLADLDVPSYLVTRDTYETLTPYWAFRALFESLLRLPAGHRDGAALQAAVAACAPGFEPWVPLLARIVDVEVPSTAEVDAIDERFRQARLQEVGARFLAAALPERTVLVFEDVHLLDADSAGLLDRLCVHAAERPWLVVVTRRDVPGGFVPQVATTSMRLAPLGDDAAAGMARRMGATEHLPPPVIEAVTRRAGGNPLFLRGLLQASVAGDAGGELPDTVEALVTSELDRLPAAERTALRFASVLGMRFERPTLRALLGSRRLPTHPEAERRMAAFMRPDGNSFRFVHQLVRDTAYETLPFRTRRALHGAAGDLLEEQAAEPDDIAEVLSLHFTHADRPDKAWHYSRVGGERAARKYAYVQAEELFARAVEAARHVSLPDDDVAATNIALGDARFRMGRQAEALGPYRAARRALRDKPADAALLLRREAEIEYRRGRLSVALCKLSRGLRLLSDGDERERAARARIEAFYAVTRHAQGRYRDALDWARRAERDARSSRDLAARAEALQAVFSAQAMLGDASHGAAAREVIDLYERLGDRAGQSRALNNLAMLAWFDGGGAEALDLFRQAQRLATAAGDTVKAVTAEYNVADVLLKAGRTEEARAMFAELVPVLRSVGLEEYVATASRALGTALALTGRPDEGAALLREARARLADLGSRAEVLETDAAIAWTALEAGDAERAAAVAGEAADQAEQLDVVPLLPSLLRLRGAALADLGRGAEAVQVLERARQLAQTHSRAELGFVLAELGRVCRGLGRTEEARGYAEAAVEQLDRLGFVGSARYPRTAVTSP